MSDRGDDEEVPAVVPVDAVALQEMLMKIQSMIPLVQDLDLLLHLADEDFHKENCSWEQFLLFPTSMNIP